MANSANSKDIRSKKLKEEMQKFNEEWTSEYCFIENAESRPLCLICNETVNVNRPEHNNNIMIPNISNVLPLLVVLFLRRASFYIFKIGFRLVVVRKSIISGVYWQ